MEEQEEERPDAIPYVSTEPCIAIHIDIYVDNHFVMFDTHPTLGVVFL